MLGQFNLCYVYEEEPYIKRVKRGKGFSYIDCNGQSIKDQDEIARLKSVAVPPTYTNVWYCPMANGHLQATGYDSKNKKQYFYHAHWAILREQSKFSSMIDFAQNLPKFRRVITQELKIIEGTKEDILSAMCRILDRTGIRVGNETASSANDTYGLTTLLKKHEDHQGSAIHLDYKGKGGKEIERDFTDIKITEVLDYCAEIPGQRLFEYKDNKGVIHTIDSSDINKYIKHHMGDSFSAKDFRTWRFSCLFLKIALKHYRADTATLKNILNDVSAISGNTPSILQSSYVHPGLIQAVKNNQFEFLTIEKEEINGLRKHENFLLNYTLTQHAQTALQPEQQKEVA